MACGGGGHGVGEGGHPADRGQEDRTAGWRRVRPLPPSAEQQAASASGEGGQLRDHRQAEAVGIGGVDAADEGVDEALVDLVAEPVTDEGADRVGGVAARQQRFGGGAQLAADGQQAARRQAQEVGGHAQEQALGDRVQTPEPDGRGGGGRRGQLAGEPDLGGEGGGVGHARQERVGALVDGGHAGERGCVQLAAESVVGFPDLDLDGAPRRCGGEGVGHRQPGDPAADDEDAVAHRPATTRSARAPMTVGSAFIDAVRRNARPWSSARRRASMSRS